MADQPRDDKGRFSGDGSGSGLAAWTERKSGSKGEPDSAKAKAAVRSMSPEDTKSFVAALSKLMKSKKDQSNIALHGSSDAMSPGLKNRIENGSYPSPKQKFEGTGGLDLDED